MTDKLQNMIDLVREADETLQADTDHPTTVLPNNFSVIDLEKYQLHRNRFTGSFRTHLVDPFFQYILMYDTIDSGCPMFVSAENMTASVIFDAGTIELPGHCSHTATLALNKTVHYEEMLLINKRPLSQDELFNWLMDWRECVDPYEGDGEEMEFLTATNNIRNINIKESLDTDHIVGDFKNQKSSLATIEATAKAGGQVLPAFFLFRCQPYEVLPARDFYLRLSVSRDHNGDPKLKLRCEGLQMAQDLLAQEFTKLLIGDDRRKGPILIGQFSSESLRA